jgi:hypothetical protein
VSLYLNPSKSGGEAGDREDSCLSTKLLCFASQSTMLQKCWRNFETRNFGRPLCSHCMLKLCWEHTNIMMFSFLMMFANCIKFTSYVDWKILMTGVYFSDECACVCVCSTLQAHIRTLSTLARVHPSLMLCPFQTLNRLPMLPHLMTLISLTKTSHPSKQACGK